MEPSRVRDHVLNDHEGLREDLARLEGLAARLGGETPDPEDGRRLRRDAEKLLDTLRVHMRWEEAYLLPLLRNADAWGEIRATQFLEDHREQRQLLAFLVERLHDDARPDTLLVRDVESLIAFLRKDMDEEESFFLDERVLRDDVVGIDVETG